MSGFQVNKFNMDSRVGWLIFLECIALQAKFFCASVAAFRECSKPISNQLSCCQEPANRNQAKYKTLFECHDIQTLLPCLDALTDIFMVNCLTKSAGCFY